MQQILINHLYIDLRNYAYQCFLHLAQYFLLLATWGEVSMPVIIKWSKEELRVGWPFGGGVRYPSAFLVFIFTILSLKNIIFYLVVGIEYF